MFQAYGSKGTALSFLNRYDDAIHAYEEGLKIDSNNKDLLADLEKARKLAKTKPIADEVGFFSDPQFIHQLVTNPKAQELLKDPETARLMKQLQDQPNNVAYVIHKGQFQCEIKSIYLFRLLTNPKVLKLVATVLNNSVGNGKGHGNKKAKNTKKPTNESTTTQNENLTSEQKQVIIYSYIISTVLYHIDH